MNFYNTYVSEDSIRRVTEVLRSGFLSEGKIVEEFEAALSNFGLSNPVCVNSGTSALHLGLVVLGVKPGDEVVLPAQTFIATGLAVLYCGATPVFADIDPCTGNVSVESVKSKITKRTKAIIPVHWGGYPCDLTELSQLGIPILEDAAHAFGAIYKDKRVGGVSTMTAFSFQAIKGLTCGDGGALCCLDPEQSEIARQLRWFGISRTKDIPSLLGERAYNLEHIGFKYHMNDVAAAIGLGNLRGAAYRCVKRGINATYYQHNLRHIPGLRLLNYKNDRLSSYWLFTVLVERRIDFIRKMNEANIPVSVVHQRIDRNRIFGGPYNLPGQAEFDENQISLPVHENLHIEDLEQIVGMVRTGW